MRKDVFDNPPFIDVIIGYILFLILGLYLVHFGKNQWILKEIKLKVKH